jgi:hypothetical protein
MSSDKFKKSEGTRSSKEEMSTIEKYSSRKLDREQDPDETEDEERADWSETENKSKSMFSMPRFWR